MNADPRGVRARYIPTFGESHGVGLGCIIDGCPPNLTLSEADIQGALNRRRPGRNGYTTARNEADTVQIMSGVFAGKKHERTPRPPTPFVQRQK